MIPPMRLRFYANTPDATIQARPHHWSRDPDRRNFSFLLNCVEFAQVGVRTRVSHEKRRAQQS